ncbi:MAG: 16S rRNA (guanine(527)-N(7))-methyltransferase RsmG [Helicobacter sp.]|nr:16S rRNA (guanine(527)-N(7))-methyltransferase RsmG [Helicobacter sp.]
MNDLNDKLNKFIELLLLWNKTHNLSGNMTQEKALQYANESLVGFDFAIENIKNVKICFDIGSGAGIPGIVLAIFHADIEFYLVEPNKKKCAFLHYVALELGLNNVKIMQTRLENLALSLSFKADLITSRALMNAKDFIKKANSLINPCGGFLLYKGSDVNFELDGIKAIIKIKDDAKTQVKYVFIKGDI